MLRLLAKFILWRHKPRVVVVTGNIGKTCAKEAIFCVLAKKFRVKKNLAFPPGDFEPTERDIIFNILGSSLANFLKTLFFPGNYPEIFVFEIELSAFNFPKYFKFLRPEVVVVTALGEIPARVEFFAGPKSQALQNFKVKVLKNLPSFGHVVLNYDDETVREIKEEIGSHSLTFGFQEGADLTASDIFHQFLPENFKNSGLNFKLNFDGSAVPIWLHQVYGKLHIYSALAAAAVGLIFKLNLIEVSQALKEYKSPVLQMTLEKGVKRTWLLNDVLKASPASMFNSLLVLKELESGGRKVAVLGDMLGVGKYTEQAHRTIGESASKFLDLLFCVGSRAKFIADEAVKRGFPKEKIFEFNTSEEAGKIIQNEIKEGDLILIKGSKEMEMEKIVKEIKEI